jgi:4-amino-4-deoxy-L-arabinose transferase-like glycosyltransferase
MRAVRLSSATSVLALAFVWLAFTAWLRPLALPDEGRYIGVAWEMVRSGEWLTPTLNGLPYFHKPPLFYWIGAAVLSVVGNQEWAGRVAPWLGACLAAASCYLFGRAHGGERLARGWLLVFVTMPLVFVSAQYANLDMLVAGCITASILAFAHAALLQSEDPARRKALLLGYVATALGMLAKGLIGFVLPGLVLVVWLLLCRRPMQILRLLWVPGLLVFALIAAPWFLVMRERFPDFLHYFFVVQHFSRYTQQGFNNAQPFWFFPVVLALFGLPWTAWVLRRVPRPNAMPQAGAQTQQVRLLMWVWLVAITGFFSLPASKLVGYILPVAAPLAWLVAHHWLALRAAGRNERLARLTGPVAALLCVGIIIGTLLVPHKTGIVLARALAPHAGEPIAFLHNYFFDVPFYARLRSPVAVVEEWDNRALTGGDNWRRELLDAAQFTGGKPSPLLLPAVLQQANCPGARSWVVGSEDLARRYPILASARRAVSSGGNAVWEVRDWVPVASDCRGTPSANSGHTS